MAEPAMKAMTRLAPRCRENGGEDELQRQRQTPFLRRVTAAGNEERANDGADAVIGLQERQSLRPEVEDALGHDRHHREEGHAQKRTGEGEERE